MAPVPIDPNYVSKDPNANLGQELHGQRRNTAHNCHFHWGNCWADSKAAHRFRAQSAQLNTGTKSFRKCTCPSASKLISVIHKESCTSQLCNNRSNLTASAHQIAQHKQSAQLQISHEIGDFLQMQDYGWVPSTKPDNCTQNSMEDFNSLGVFTKGTKINSLNKFCCQFNTNILAGCKTQAYRHQASKEQQFRNVIGVGMETRSIVAHNVNEGMQRNQYGGCTMMAMGCFFSEVIKTGVDPYRLGWWCWFRVGSGD